jgi:hypothetical protein
MPACPNQRRSARSEALSGLPQNDGGLAK